MSTHYPTRGGHSERGIAAGMFALNFNIINSAIGWGSSAALSLLHIILFVVVFLVVMTIAVYSLFILTMLLVFHTGTMELLYFYMHIHIILFVVVLLVVILIVVLSLFLLTVLLLVHSGAVVLLYYKNI